MGFQSYLGSFGNMPRSFQKKEDPSMAVPSPRTSASATQYRSLAACNHRDSNHHEGDRVEAFRGSVSSSIVGTPIATCLSCNNLRHNQHELLSPAQTQSRCYPNCPAHCWKKLEAHLSHQGLKGQCWLRKHNCCWLLFLFHFR